MEYFFDLSLLSAFNWSPFYGCRSSHRKYSLGRPDQRDLSENLAATQGLANMITEAQRLFQVQKPETTQDRPEETKQTK